MNDATKHGGPVDVLTQSAPPRVWLQVDTDGDDEDRGEAILPSDWCEMTWHYERIGGQEVEYVRLDMVAELIEADKAYDAARQAHSDTYHSGGVVERSVTHHALEAAKKRRRAALANIGAAS